jgi:hypothetical protein
MNKADKFVTPPPQSAAKCNTLSMHTTVLILNRNAQIAAIVNSKHTLKSILKKSLNLLNGSRKPLTSPKSSTAMRPKEPRQSISKKKGGLQKRETTLVETTYAHLYLTPLLLVTASPCI